MSIRVDGFPKDVRLGPWVVKDLKVAVGIDPAKVLAKIMPMGLERLRDNATTEIEDGLSFMSHARAGGAS